jgi:outer membrane protein assembly factor BamB
MLVGVLVLVAACGEGGACGAPAKPEGWMPPSPVDGEQVLDGDTLYVTLDAGRISSIDMSEEPWSENWDFGGKDDFQCGNESQVDSGRELKGIYGSPVVYQDRVFFGAYDGNVYALDTANGSCVWVFEGSDGPIVGGVTLAGDVLYFGSDDGNLYGVDPSTGERRIAFDAGGSIWSTPLADENHLYFATMNGKLWAVTVPEFHPAWPDGPFETSAGLLTDPLIVDGVLIVGGIGKELFGLDPATGEEVWEEPFEGDNWWWGDPAMDGNTLYFPNMDHRVYAVDATTGDAVWSSGFEANEAIRSAPALADGSLTVVDREGNVFTVNAESGQAEQSAPKVLDKKVLANPALVGDGVLIVTQGGDLYQLDPSGESPPTVLEVVE